jgi:hypothetical protein
VSEQIEVAGEVSINSKLVSTTLFVYLSQQGSLFIGDGAGMRRSMQLYTFNSAMTNALDYRLIARPIQYSIEGTRLGGYSQQFGDPRDGDFDFRSIKRVQIRIAHNRTSVRYSIVGLASAADGHVADRRVTGTDKGDWEFNVSFRVPREALPALYGLTESAASHLFEAMNALDDAA